MIEDSADALPYTPGARYTGKYAGDCKTNKGEDNLKNIFAVRRGSSDSGTGQEK